MGNNMKQFNLQEYLKNPDREVVTRNGRKVRIICTDRKGVKPIIALVNGGLSDCKELFYSFFPDGKKDERYKSEFDLFFAPEKHEGWIIINKWPNGVIDTDGIIYHTELDIPDILPIGGKRIATIKIEWEE